MNNPKKKLKGLSQSNSGKILRAFIKEWKQDIRDVSQDLPVDCENELKVRKNMVKIIEKELESRLKNEDKAETKEKTSFE